MPRIESYVVLLRACFLALVLAPAMLVFSSALGCHAQQPAPAATGAQGNGHEGNTSIDAALSRRIEVAIRSRFNVPAQYLVQVGATAPSKLAGYREVVVTFSGPARDKATTSSATFLLSDDGTKLARLETFDLTKTFSDRISIAGRPVRGSADAKVTVINYDDLECPYCARMHRALFPETMNRYKDKVNFVYKDFPLVDIHPWAMHASVDANCLASLSGDAYWHYVDYLHEHGQEVTGPDRDPKKSFLTLDRLAKEEAERGHLDATKVDACLQKQDEAVVRASMSEGESLGVEGTPALFIDGERINGAVSAPEVWAVIDRALRAKGIEPPAAPPAAATPSPAQ